MRPTTAINDNIFDFQALLHPGTVFEHPKDVASHPDLTLAEKRAILNAAIDAVLHSEPVHPEQKPSIGCNIKWKL